MDVTQLLSPCHDGVPGDDDSGSSEKRRDVSMVRTRDVEVDTRTSLGERRIDVQNILIGGVTRRRGYRYEVSSVVFLVRFVSRCGRNRGVPKVRLRSESSNREPPRSTGRGGEERSAQREQRCRVRHRGSVNRDEPRKRVRQGRKTQ